MKKKTIIISYVFPPNEGIGGRRWAKFAKYLKRGGHEVSIITTNLNGTKSNWEKDVDELKGSITYLDSNYPHYLGISPSSIFEKIGYRLSAMYGRAKLRGNYYDKGAYWGKNLISSVEDHINKGYNNVVVSTAPFHNAIHLLPLIDKYKEVNFIVDFRDPWISVQRGYGFQLLSEKRKNHEREAELAIINNYHSIISVANDMTRYFRSLNTNNSAKKFLTIPNGFDKDDFKIENDKSESSERFKLVFTGTFYPEAKYILDNLMKALDELLIKNPSAYNRLDFNFYGRMTFPIEKYNKLHSGIMKFNGTVSPSDVHKAINSSDACMLFLQDDINYSFSTKFCEYLYFKKPIIVFSKKGGTAEFIEKNNIGVTIQADDIYNGLLPVVDYLANVHTDNPKLEKIVKDFDIKEIVKYLDDILIE